MYCTRCGKLNDDSAAACVHCDNALRLPSPPPIVIPNYLIFALLAAFCCCWPVGIPAVVYSILVSSRASAGDIAGARSASRNAKIWCWVAFGAGVIYAAVVAVAALAGAFAQHH